MKVLGLHIGHNATAALVKDGHITAVMQEERLSRIKNASGIPSQAISEVLRISGLTGLDQVDRVAVCGTLPPYQPTDSKQVLQDCQHVYGRGEGRFRKARLSLASSRWLRAKWKRFHSNRYLHRIREEMAQHRIPLDKVTLVDHHECHASMAYYGFGRYEEQVLVLTNDGAGDGICATINIGSQGQLTRIDEVSDHHSVATMYGMITYLMGMIPLEHEYKVMGLAPYGRSSQQALSLYRSLWELVEWVGASPMRWRRRTGVPLGDSLFPHLERLVARHRFDHIAAAVQAFTEDFLREWITRCVKETGIHRLCLSGGIFMNVKANQLILALPDVDHLFIVPSCGDESNACGAALAIEARSHLDQNRRVAIPGLSTLYWGGRFSPDQIEKAVKSFSFSSKVSIEHVESPEKTLASLLVSGKIVARFADRMEFGARALGNRSILADASNPDVTRIINEAIKCRDFWMPFAPSVLCERSEDYLIKPKPMDAPYMIMTFDSQPASRQFCRAAMHPNDFTLRPQEVEQSANESYYAVLKEFEARTGQGIVLNTSFNLHGEPLVYTPDDALRVFDRSGLEHLMLDRVYVRKE